MLTIVTAAHRNVAGLRALSDHLVPYLSEHVRWRVKDSGACVETLSWQSSIPREFFDFDATPDSGIYDALNKALAGVTTEYYLVVGSDDTLDASALPAVLKLLSNECSQADILSFPVRIGSKLRRAKQYWPLFLSSSGLVSSHSVGTILKTSLHKRFGLYDTRYRILADSLFLRKAHDGGAVFDSRTEPVMGHFDLNGVSSTAHGRRIAETYSYQVECGSSPFLQSILMMLRTVRFKPGNLL